MRLLGVPSPRYSYPRSYRDSRSCFCLTGVPQTSTDLELLCGAASSRARHRFILGTDRSPDWFRLLSDCFGRTDRHRRTGGNRSIPRRFLSLNMVAYHLKTRIMKSRTGYRSVDWFRVVGFILRLNPQVFSSYLYKEAALATTDITADFAARPETKRGCQPRLLAVLLAERHP